MVIFFAAGAEDNKEVNEKIISFGCNRLLSYYHISTKAREYKKLKEYYGYDQLLFIDSGAFSAWSLGSKIDIDEYIGFCKETDADYYSVLDDIKDPEKTLRSQQYMEEHGVKPVPCFHYGEPWSYMDYYYERYDFISIGGLVGKEKSRVRAWLEILFRKYPNKKFHGFGLTRFDLVQEFPWYSVDSSSWTMGGRSGTIFTPEFGSLHYDEIDKDASEKARYTRAELERLGYDKDLIKEDYSKRMAFNIQQYMKIQGLEYTPRSTSQLTLLETVKEEEPTVHEGYPAIVEEDFEEYDFQIYRKQYPGLNEEQVLRMWRLEQ